MALPWVRLDTNIASHDKILSLLSDPSPRRHQSCMSYMFSIAWSGGHGTDGRIPKAALPFIHGNDTTARLLCKYGLWEARTADWLIVNYAERQELDVIAESKRALRSTIGKKAACVRHHDKDCGCWRDGK